MRLATFKADALLLLVAAIWGCAFVAQRAGMEHVGPWTFTGVRLAIGLLVVLPVIWVRHWRDGRRGARPPRSARGPAVAGIGRGSYLRGGLLAGVVMGLGAGLQQIGLVYTTAGKAAFITGLYVIFVPIIGLFVRHRAGLPTWAGAVLAAVGLYLLSVKGSFTVNPGDRYVLACAVVWAVHVLVIGRFAPHTDPFKLAAVQLAVASALGLIAAVLTEKIALDTLLAAGWAILYAGACSAGIAFTLQVVAQRHAPPAHAAILLSCEAVFAALAGGLLLNETLSGQEALGCALMLAGILSSQMRRTERPVPQP